MGEIEVKSALERWVVANARDGSVSHVPYELDLFTGRVVDSLASSTSCSTSKSCPGVRSTWNCSILRN